ncbi:AMP-binding protein [Amycolatopsis acidicola]|uniref:AMP-binding protein n=1 Tax=Amycolatopsis acidicola TaxID=2596893 RepID=A0A5N0V0R8_9PSEU|nr:AMP-binding protein [Amycolatopsis acidicola]KAA9160067.1 AMP-binding protein [Amycolatopsis acidicola]
MLVPDFVRNNARSRGGSVAIVSGDREYTYAALQELIEQTAGALSARGISYGDRVAVLAKNSLEYVQLYFATAAIGAILVPLNFWHRAAEHAYTISDSDPALWFVEETYDEVSREARAAHPDLPVLRIPGPEGDRGDWDAFLAAAREAPRTDVDERDPHMILYTSGTTGRPKGAMLSHRRTADDALAMAATMRVDDRDVFMNYFPPFHVGNWDHMKPFLLMGGKVVLLREFEPGVVLDLLPRHRVSVILGVPTMLHALITHPRFPGTDISSVRLLYYGAYDPSGIMDRAADAFGAREGKVRFAHTYGLTEGGPFVTWCPPRDVFERWGSIGRAMPGVDIALLDDTGAEVAPGEPGEICVRGPRMSGYWRNEEASAVALAGDWLHTGDVAVADADGFLTIVDRKKDMIRSGGQNVWSKEVEDCLARHPGVADVAVIGLPDPVYEEQVAAIVIPAGDGTPELAGELTAFVKANLAGYNTPKQVHFVREFPRTAVGKIQKHVLRARFGA